MFATSCTSKKQHCDAYGEVSIVENAKSVDVISVSNELIIEKKS